MPIEFTKREQCGIIFANSNGTQTLCTKCRGEEPAFESPRELLRYLKNMLRDAQAHGEFLTIPELASKADVTEVRIWAYIRTGDLDTAGFNDPQVREYIVKRRKELTKNRQAEPDQAPANKGPERSKHAGFHLRVEDDKNK